MQTKETGVDGVRPVINALAMVVAAVREGRVR